MSCGGPESSRSIFAQVVRLQRAGRSAVLATPLWRSGSAPVSVESKLLYADDGAVWGTVGGGALEARVLGAAPQVLAEGLSRVLEFDLTQEEAVAGGMICGGRCAILLEPIAPDRDVAAFAAAAQAQTAGEGVALVTLLLPHGARKLAVRQGCAVVVEAMDPAIAAALERAADEALRAGRPRFLEQPVRAHIDPLLPSPTVFIFGAGHIAVPVAHLADLAGFRVVVVDDRAEFANDRRFPRADRVLVAPVGSAFAELSVDRAGFVVAVTRGHALDEEVVAWALNTPARYIGMVGSKRKVSSVLERLRRRGFTDDELGRVHAPIGLDIGAETVEEIAVSIAAELIAVRRSAG